MAESYRALCSDFYVNMKVQVKLELPRSRETVLELFERIRRQFPAMAHFRRFKEELALEAPQSEMPHRWVAIRSSTIRSGVVNAGTLKDGYALHLQLLETAPHYLSISPLDVDHIELLYGFDLLASGNHDAIVFDAMFANSPMAGLADIRGAEPIDVQPFIGLVLGERRSEDGASPGTELGFEIKTRSDAKHAPPPEADSPGEPISVYLSLRKFGPFADLKDLPTAFSGLARRGEELIESRVVPHLLGPIRDAIASSNG
jgi:hypothetical protein